MTHGSDHTQSWYAASAQPHPRFPTLEGDHKADVCVIGGGYTGLSTAIHLRKLGFTVALLEANRVGWGASGRNGGHVGTGQRAGQDELEAMVGMETARTLWQFGLDAVELVTDLVHEFDIDCELGSGDLHLAAKAAHAVDLRDEVEHLRTHYNYDGASYLDVNAIAERTSARGAFGGMLDTRARHLHPLKYAFGLARAAEQLGADIYEGSPALDYREADKVTVRTPKGSVRAPIVVLACNAYLDKLEPRIAGNIMPINNFVVATEPLSEDLARQINRDNVSLSDTLFVINYWKLSQDKRLVFGGGETYSPNFPTDIPAFVRPHVLKKHPELQDVKIEYGWGGAVGITLNRMPDFGRLGQRVFYAHGFSGHGVPTATFAGQLLAAAIDGDAEKFDVMAAVPTQRFPGGTLLRRPGLVAGMLFYSLMDRLGR